MKCELFLTDQAKRDFLALEKSTQKRIAEKLRFFIASNDPLQYAKKLKNPIFGSYRFRIGDYRAIFDLSKKNEINILMILRVKHRRDVYE